MFPRAGIAKLSDRPPSMESSQDAIARAVAPLRSSGQGGRLVADERSGCMWGRAWHFDVVGSGTQSEGIRGMRGEI